MSMNFSQLLNVDPKSAFLQMELLNLKTPRKGPSHGRLIQLGQMRYLAIYWGYAPGADCAELHDTPKLYIVSGVSSRQAAVRSQYPVSLSVVLRNLGVQIDSHTLSVSFPSLEDRSSDQFGAQVWCYNPQQHCGTTGEFHCDFEVEHPSSYPARPSSGTVSCRYMSAGGFGNVSLRRELTDDILGLESDSPPWVRFERICEYSHHAFAGKDLCLPWGAEVFWKSRTPNSQASYGTMLQVAKDLSLDLNFEVLLFFRQVWIIERYLRTLITDNPENKLLFRNFSINMGPHCLRSLEGTTSLKTTINQHASHSLIFEISESITEIGQIQRLRGLVKILANARLALDDSRVDAHLYSLRNLIFSRLALVKIDHQEGRRSKNDRELRGLITLMIEDSNMNSYGMVMEGIGDAVDIDHCRRLLQEAQAPALLIQRYTDQPYTSDFCLCNPATPSFQGRACPCDLPAFLDPSTV